MVTYGNGHPKIGQILQRPTAFRHNPSRPTEQGGTYKCKENETDPASGRLTEACLRQASLPKVGRLRPTKDAHLKVAATKGRETRDTPLDREGGHWTGPELRLRHPPVNLLFENARPGPWHAEALRNRAMPPPRGCDAPRCTTGERTPPEGRTARGKL